ncbi:LysR substrate-binding domain-containing protein [Dyella telluris]|uniref:LysR family transcriptional regulator n=1 Tax=Dyella telluris TaxID=2763498 RepID=A0A7G8PZ50_9GAMM|nr:LysR substrate-binding domain-containing protein [Dyella telluris]QNJ99807.1 LysR family transcriptional regulator [Dyella telluris]
MRRITFDLDVLRTFVAGVELGSFAKAAERLNRSTSAVSAQLKKLEEQAGTPVLRKSGRGMSLTEAGETMLAYARRLLELNDEAAVALHGAELAGGVRLGLQEDFGESMLTEVLGRFARAHPRVKVEVRIARNVDLLERIATGRLDLALAWDAGTVTPYTERMGTAPLRWIAGADAAPAWPRDDGEPLPLVMLDAPCIMRTAATTALDRANIPWRIAFTSASLAGIWAAVAAGLGVSLRTPHGLPASVRALLPHETVLPSLGELGLSLHRAEAEPASAVEWLAGILTQQWQGLPLAA